MQVKTNGCPAVELPPYGLEMVPLDKIFLEDYQREEDSRWVQARSGEKMDPELLHPVVLVRVGGRYACVEGQHRVAIARESGRGFIFAMIYVERDKPARAGLWLETNIQRQRVTAVQRYDAGWRNKRPMYLAIKAALDAHGIQAKDYAKRPMTTGAIATLEDVYKHARHNKAEALKITVSVLVEAGFAKYESLKTDPLWAVGEVVARYGPAVDYDHLVMTLKEERRGGLVERARHLARGKRNMGGSRSTELPKAMVELYNEYKPEQALPEWTGGGRS